VKMSNVSMRIDGMMVFVAMLVGAVIYISIKRQAVVDAVNPANQENIINSAAKDVVGKENLQSVFNRIYGAVDLVNPWARQVWGLE